MVVALYLSSCSIEVQKVEKNKNSLSGTKDVEMVLKEKKQGPLFLNSRVYIGLFNHDPYILACRDYG